MSDWRRSDSEVIVTFGPTGRVVKRVGVGLADEVKDATPFPRSTKRSVRDTLAAATSLSHNKRQRRPETTTNSIDLCLAKDDLRFKLMQKDTAGESSSTKPLRNVDLRYKLSSKTSRPSAVITSMRPPESAASTRHPPHPRRVAGITAHPVRDSRDTNTLPRFPPSTPPTQLSAIPFPTYSSRTLENARGRSPQNLRRRSPEILRRRSPEILRRRSPDILRPRSPEILRHRSPERLLPSSASRGLSPQTSRQELLTKPLLRSYDDGRSASFVRIGPTTTVRSSPYVTQSYVPPPAVSSVMPASHYAQPSGIMQKADIPPTVDSLLQSLGLEKYAIYFKAEEVDMNALRQLGDSDLKDLGIPMGPRKKILQAVMPRARRQL